MKKYRHILAIVLLLAISVSSFYACTKTSPPMNTPAVTIKFESNDGDFQGSILTIPPNTTITETNPTREGFVFQGWFDSSDMSGERFDFSTKLSADMTLYAKWAPMNAPPSELYLGEYPQQLVTNNDTIIALDLATPDDDGYYIYNERKYSKVIVENKGKALTNGYTTSQSYYFEVLPLEWVILDTVDGNYILITKDIIDTVPYHNTDIDITYADSDIRNFLNNDFLNKAFDTNEKTQIVTSVKTNLNNPNFGTLGGINTSDKVYLLSIDEAKNGAYFDSDMARLVSGTDYAKAQGLFVNPNFNFENCSQWWLRSPGDRSNEDGLNYNNAASIDSSGKLSIIGSYITKDEIGIRPVIFVPISLFA